MRNQARISSLSVPPQQSFTAADCRDLGVAAVISTPLKYEKRNEMKNGPKITSTHPKRDRSVGEMIYRNRRTSLPGGGGGERTPTKWPG